MAGGCWGATGLLYRLSDGCRQAPCCCWLGCWELCRLTQQCRMVGQQRPAGLGRHQQRGNTIITPNSLNLCTGPPRSRANAEGGLPGEPNHASVHGGPAGSAAAAAAAAAAGCDCGKVRVDFYGESLCPDCQVGRPTCWSGKAGRQISQQARDEVEQQVALPRLLRAPGPELSERAGLCGRSLLCCAATCLCRGAIAMPCGLLSNSQAPAALPVNALCCSTWCATCWRPCSLMALPT